MFCPGAWRQLGFGKVGGASSALSESCGSLPAPAGGCSPTPSAVGGPGLGGRAGAPALERPRASGGSVLEALAGARPQSVLGAGRGPSLGCWLGPRPQRRPRSWGGPGLGVS